MNLDPEKLSLKFKNTCRLFLIFLFVPYYCFAGTIDKIQVSRPDGSILTAYLTSPENLHHFPIAIIVHGSVCESVLSWHEDFHPLALQIGAALVTLEKQGIYSVNEIDGVEYDDTNTVPHRIEDHLFFIEKLREGNLIPGWNGRMILIGGSEGGRVAAAVSAQTPEVKATALFTCGGGLTTEEELRLAITKYYKSHGESDAEIEEAQYYITKLIQDMTDNPSPEKRFMEYTYKWWVSHINHYTMNDILKIEHPLFYAHGTEDTVVPIESADRLARQLQNSGKSNFYYYRIEGYGHDMRTFPPQVVVDMLKMFDDNRSELFPR